MFNEVAEVVVVTALGAKAGANALVVVEHIRQRTAIIILASFIMDIMLDYLLESESGTVNNIFLKTFGCFYI
jgi:hypothetical protein